MRKKTVFKNAGAATLQVMVSGLSLFFLYRYLLSALGAEQLGIWSVVLATTSASRITELGLTGSVVKFVAKYLALNEREKTGELIQTAALSLALFTGTVLAAAYFPVVWILAGVLPASALPAATEILPIALASLWITTIGGIFQSGLDGCQRTDLRALFNIINSLALLGLSILLVHRYGLLGLAYAQLGLALLLLLMAWTFLKKELRCLPFIPYRWHKKLFREMLGYGVNFQVAGFLSMTYDPITKALLSLYGDLSMVTYFEMGSRMVMQFRSLLTAPSQVLVPVIANLQETQPERIQAVYQDTYRIQVYFSIPLQWGVISALPWISALWIGKFEETFIQFSILLASGWFINGLCNPSYFSNLGTGKLKWNTIAHASIGLLNPLLGIPLGMELGGLGVVLAWVLALGLGSLTLVFAFHNIYQIPYRRLFPLENFPLLVASTFGIGFAWYSFHQTPPQYGLIGQMLTSTTAFTLAILIPFWLHPMRGRILSLITKRQAAPKQA